jgi:NADPH2:quinone reductase
MKVIIGHKLGQFEDFSIQNLSCPEPLAGQVQVEVHCAGVTFVDALIASGRHQVAVDLPFIPGNEVSGVICGLGQGAEKFSVGDRVACVGVGGKYAEVINVTESSVLKIPDSLPFAEASVFRGGFACAYHALVQGSGLSSGDRVMVMGAAGAVGLAAVQIAAALGARVMASASSLEKRELALRYGAEIAIDSHSENWREQVRQWTAGCGLDVVVDPVGGDATERAFRSLALGGRHLVIGFASGVIPSLPINLALLKGASLIGIELSKFEKRFPVLATANEQALLQLFLRGAIQAPPIAHHFQIEEFRQALSMAATGNSVGSIVLQIRQNESIYMA